MTSCIVTLFWITTAGVLLAQDSQSSSDPSGSSSASGSDVTFDDHFTEWKQVIKDIRAIRLAYEDCSREEAIQLALEWDQKIERGNELIQLLKVAGIEEFRSDPKGRQDLVPFLSRMVKTDVDADRYDSAYEIGSILRDNESLITFIYNDFGVAAFATNRFAEAEDYLTKALGVGRIDERGREYLSYVAEKRQLWQEELANLERDQQKGDLPRVRMETTKGVMIIELFEDDAPETVGNFVHLVEKGFYDGLTFHRVLAGFVAQGGCPIGKGTGSPGYLIYSEYDKDTARNHFRGYLSMANTGAPNSGGSQFFITMRPTPNLNGKHTVFGRVIEGIEVLEELVRLEPGTPEFDTLEADKMIKVEVLSKRDHEYVPNKVGTENN